MNVTASPVSVISQDQTFTTLIAQESNSVVAESGTISKTTDSSGTTFLNFTNEDVHTALKKAVFEQHQFNNVMPIPKIEAINSLAESMQLHGQKDPIKLFQGKILDGWNRYICCLLLDYEPIKEEITGSEEEAASVILTSNERRQLTQQQKYAIFLRLQEKCPSLEKFLMELKAKGHQNKKGGKALSDNIEKVNQLQVKANLAGVSKSTAGLVEKAYKEDHDVLQAILDNGTIPRIPKISPQDMQESTSFEKLSSNKITVNNGQIESIVQKLQDKGVVIQTENNDVYYFQSPENLKKLFRVLGALVDSEFNFAITIG
jgi:hypothetical protein